MTRVSRSALKSDRYGNISEAAGSARDISARDISAHRTAEGCRAHCTHMTTKHFRELCEEVLVPMLTGALEQQLRDIHDMLDVSAGELVRIGERLDELGADNRGDDE